MVRVVVPYGIFSGETQMQWSGAQAERAPAAPLPLATRIGWALGQLPIAGHVGIVSFYLLYFVTDVHHIPPAIAGIALLLPRIFNIIFDPIVGSVSDRTRSRFGRRRPYLLGGALVWGIAMAFLFGLPTVADKFTAAAIIFGAYMAVSIGQTLYHVPYSAMLAEMAQNNRERISLAGWKEAVSRLGILAAASVVPLVVASFASETLGYRIAGLIFGLIIIVGGTIAFLSTAGAPATPLSTENTSFRRQLQAIAENRPFRLLLGTYALVMVADEIFSGTLVFYAVNVLGRTPAFVGQAYPISSIAAVVAIPLWNALALRIGKQRAFLASILGMMATWVSVAAIPPAHGWIMLPLMAVVGAFNAGLLMLPNAMLPDTIEYDAAHSGARREGAIYGAWIFFQSSAMALGAFALSMILASIGYQGGAHAQSSLVIQGITLTLSVVPAGLLLIAWLILRRYPLADAD